MNTFDALMTRRSVRKYTDAVVSREDIDKILKAGMAAPSCVNSRDWSFIVVTDRERLNLMADANGKPAAPLRSCAFAILVCGDLDRAFAGAKDYWIIDGALAGENMVIAAKELGIGSVWLGTWPQMNRVEAQQKLFALPETIIPHSIIAFGYPDEEPARRSPEWEEDRVHYEAW